MFCRFVSIETYTQHAVVVAWMAGCMLFKAILVFGMAFCHTVNMCTKSSKDRPRKVERIRARRNKQIGGEAALTPSPTTEQVGGCSICRYSPTLVTCRPPSNSASLYPTSDTSAKSTSLHTLFFVFFSCFFLVLQIHADPPRRVFLVCAVALC